MDRNGIDRILEELGMHPDCYVLEDCARNFRAAMERGLSGDRSGMMMLPTFLSADGQVPLGEKVLVLDAGGTNLRRAVASFDERGNIVLEHFQRRPMPGTRGEVGVPEFFDEIAEFLLPVLPESDRISFCFSYATTALPNGDGRLHHFCKEVYVRDSAGIEVCAELQKALARKGVGEGKHCVLLNDSVAALLGGKAASQQDFDSYLGYVYGTGTNCCYVEETSNISGTDGYAGHSMIVNMESGIHATFPQGEADRLVDEESEFPGDHLFEKMMSGAYLGRLMTVTAQCCARKGIFTEAGAAEIMAADSFDLKDVGDLWAGGAMPGLTLVEEDQQALRQIADRLYERAAKLVAVTIGCVLCWTNTGRDAKRPVCISIEGTTFRKSAAIRRHFFRYEAEYLNRELGVFITLLEREDTTLAGTAVAGLLN